MEAPPTCSSNFQGPVPIGWRSAPCSPAASMWRLDWMKAHDANSPWFTLLPNTTKGLSKCTVSVWGFSTSMLLIARNSGASELAEPSLAMEAKVNGTSSAVSSAPLWKRTPLRRWNLHVRPPSSTCQRSASMGASSPVFGSRVRRFSYIGLRTTSSAPTYRGGSQRSLPNVATATVSVPSGLAATLDGAARSENHAVRRARAIANGRFMSGPPVCRGPDLFSTAGRGAGMLPSAGQQDNLYPAGGSPWPEKP